MMPLTGCAISYHHQHGGRHFVPNVCLSWIVYHGSLCASVVVAVALVVVVVELDVSGLETGTAPSSAEIHGFPFSGRQNFLMVVLLLLLLLLFRDCCLAVELPQGEEVRECSPVMA
jgi:hypothetical protein